MLVDVIFWGIVFIISLTVLLKGADYLIENAEKIGLSRGISPFIVGVVIVGIGTSLPELVAAVVASIQGVTEIVPANAIGSNIANILLVLGVTAVVTKKLFVEKNLIYLDLPMLAAATLLFLGVAADTTLLEDGSNGPMVTRGEAAFLVLTYLVYLGYSLFYQDDYIKKIKSAIDRPEVTWANYWLLALGAAGVVLGGKYVVDSTVKLAEIFEIGVGVIAVFAIALGTSLPELFVSVRAAQKGKPELSFGNILGSNVFNMLMLVGLPGLIQPLALDEKTFSIGIPALIIATFILVISGISNKVHLWDGAMYLMLYTLFIAKLFGIF